ncbi:MAG: GIY-YIG nuclease family protein [Streptomyces sp.]|nr:GIY-YIG nuclease family protein [Streptomyces sp.]
MTAIPRPTGKAARILDTVLSWLTWATQIAALTCYMTVTALSPVWATMWADDAFTVVCLWGMSIGMAILWMISLREEHAVFHDPQASMEQRKMSRLAHLCVLLVSVLAASGYQSRLGVWFVLALAALYARTTWAAWARSRSLPTETPAVLATQPEPHHAPAPEWSWQLPDRKHTPVVYFIRNGNRLKIGTTTDIKRRIRTLALRAENVVLVLDGGKPLERNLHKQFADLRIGNTEWFAYDGALINYIADQNRLARKEEAK